MGKINWDKIREGDEFHQFALDFMHQKFMAFKAAEIESNEFIEAARLLWGVLKAGQSRQDLIQRMSGGKGQ